jgi:hypothetical protein
MNKRGLVKYIFVLMAAAISIYFLTANDTGFNGMSPIVLLFMFLYALPIFMFRYKNKIKKCKFIYDVILMLLMIFSIGISIFFLYNEIACYFKTDCFIELTPIFTALYPIFLFLMLLFGTTDIFHKTNKANDIFAISVSSLIILIHLRYYFDPNFAHKIIESESYNQFRYYYIAQNHVYFVIMYLIVLLHHRVNKI